MYAVIVHIVANPGKEQELENALRANAAGSREEDGCLKWEWSRDTEDPSRYAIYEVYTDREAFEAHKGSHHFAEWVEASGPCMAEKTAGRYDLTDSDGRAY